METNKSIILGSNEAIVVKTREGIFEIRDVKEGKRIRIAKLDSDGYASIVFKG